MPPVTKVGDQPDLVPTSRFVYGKFPFEYFNCVQSRVFDYHDKANNLVVAAPTGVGKTVVAEMLLAHEIRQRGGKGVYLAPLRALAQEKIDDWTTPGHHFADLKLSICTGDYRLTAARRKELEAADLIVMTSEMLNSRCRNFKSEKNTWLQKVKTITVDENHLITVPSRGDHLEVGLMKFTEMNPDARLVLLSATMPNVDEIADWVSYILTGRDTVMVSSTYRPVPLNVHYEKYYDGEQSYDANEEQKVATALSIVDYYPDDKFLIFAHTKKTGELMKQALLRAGKECEFHTSDLDKDKRNKLIDRYKTDPKFKILVATSGLAWGINSPSRRVIVLGMHRGMSEVATYDIFQSIGRAGRPGYDPVGDAYLLLPEGQYDMHKARLKKPELIRSQMLEQVGGKYKTLAFHLVSEIHQQTVKDRDDVAHWYKRSLACFQAKELDDEVVNSTVDLLKKCGAVWEEDGKLTATSVGKVASLFYYSPFDAADLRRNFTTLFDERKEDDDVWLSVALGNLDTQRAGIVSRADREEMGRYAGQVDAVFGKGAVYEPAVKAGFAYSLLLAGRPSTVLAGYMRGLQFDFPRLNQVLLALDGFGGRWNRKEWFNMLQLRVAHGVKGPMAYLCQLPNVGKVRAGKLWAAGLRTIAEVAENPGRANAALGLKKDLFEEVMTAAQSLRLAG